MSMRIGAVVKMWLLVALVVFSANAVLAQNDTLFNGDRIPKTYVPGSRFANISLPDSSFIGNRITITLVDSPKVKVVTTIDGYLEVLRAQESAGPDVVAKLSQAAIDMRKPGSSGSIGRTAGVDYDYAAEIASGALTQSQCIVFDKFNHRLIRTIRKESWIKWYGSKYWEGGYTGERYFHGERLLFSKRGLVWN